MDDTGTGQALRSDGFSGILETAMRVLTDPKGFYSAMPKTGPLDAVGLFAGVMLLAAAVIQAVFALFFAGFGAFFFALILTPIFGAIGLLIGAAIVFFASRALGGDATFESSARIVGYASAILPVTTLVAFIPYLALLPQAYGMYLVIVAIIAVHGVPENKAWTVLGGIAAVLLLLSLLSTIAARRVAPKVETFGTHLEKGAEEFGKAAEKWAEEMERATEKMRKDLERSGEEANGGEE